MFQAKTPLPLDAPAETKQDTERREETPSFPILRTCFATYLQAGTSRMALLLLGAIGARSLAAGALAARGLALAASHGVDVGIQIQMQVSARGGRDGA